MISILVANTKGGCGKTTIATHLAAAFARSGHTVALADADRQKSALAWGKRRPESAPRIDCLDWGKDIDKPPRSAARLVIDAPAGMPKKKLEDLVRRADFVVLPVLPSIFDEGATERFLVRLNELKPIRKNRKAVAVIGNRLRSNTRAAQRLDTFLDGVGHQVVTRLRDTQIYPEVAAGGLSLFDLNNRRAQAFLVDWSPLMRFLDTDN